MRYLSRFLSGMLLVLASCLLLVPPASADEPALEETSSGAPSAIMMLPATEAMSPKGSSMKPVVFNHLLHERKIEDCTACHHTGDPQKCGECHSLEGKKEGGYVTLERAMHTRVITSRTGGVVPNSCVSCHERQLKQRQCAGCHSLVKPSRDDRWCAVCHTVTKDMTADQLRQAAMGTLPDEEREALAVKTVLEKRYATPLRPEFLPTRLRLDSLSHKYGPNYFGHRRHVASLMSRIEGDNLAAAFHTDPATLCTACHHNSPASATPPPCANCHGTRPDPTDPGKPDLKAAYHLQCMGCHDAMQVARPIKTNCVSCHKPIHQ